MLIRPAREADAPAIASHIRMAEIEMAHHFTGTRDKAASIQVLVRYVLNPVPNRYSLEHCQVAEEEGRAIGTIISFPADRQPELDPLLLEALNSRGYDLEKLFFEGEPGSWYLSTMGVDPDRRGRGVGSALLGAARDRGKALGFALASLLVSAAKERTADLYRRLGFRAAGRVTIAEVEYLRMLRDL